jgi:6-phosphogluconolactonase/glucosamine-6-phosphate isomerase/deaminase
MQPQPAAFQFRPAACVPFRDCAAIDRVRRIRRAEITRHPNPDFRIQVVPDHQVEPMWIADMFKRIRLAMEAGQPLVMIMPNPWPGYVKLARLLNEARIDCRRLHTFNMDEYANEDGVIAPESWEFGFMHAFKKYFWSALEADLRPPENQVHGPNNANIDVYGKMIADLGGADICYSGPGWTGHLAFIEPDAAEFAAASLEEWKRLGPRICTLSPFTIAQNSLHGSFGMSGDLAAVPPKAATIGPAEVIAAKNRVDMHAITIDGSFASWQRFTTRLALHGPVSPRVPQSILQTLPTEVWVSESIAADIEPHWDKGY